MKKTTLFSLVSLLLLFFSTAIHSQELQTLEIPLHRFKGDGGYTWNPTGGCETIEPTGSIIAKWTCTPGTAPQLSFDFTGFNFINTSTNTVVNPDYAYVYEWIGPTSANEWQPGGSIPSPPVPEYLSTMQAGPYAMPTNIPQGKLNITMRFVIEEFTFGSEYPGTQCFADIVLPEIDFTCPCDENEELPKPRNEWGGDVCTIPGIEHDEECIFTLYECFWEHNVPQHQTEWTFRFRVWENGVYGPWSDPVYYYGPTVHIPYWVDRDENGNIEAYLQFMWPSMRIWNCFDETLGGGACGQPREHEEMAPFFGSNFQPESNIITVYPTMLSSGDEIHVSISNLDAQQLTKLQILDMSGRNILEKSIDYNESMLSTQGLTPGMYLVVITDNKNIFHQEKIVIY